MLPFIKYHALGNDYIVIDPADLPQPPSPELIRRICHRNYGPGSDGILYGPLPAANADFGLRIFNPDGSEAEKSGNGLRIFARCLWDAGLLAAAEDGASLPFTIHTAGGVVRAQVQQAGAQARVAMGQASFNSRRILMAGPERDVVNETMEIDGERLEFCAVTVGNPHCVVLNAGCNEALARRLGPRIECNARFPNRINVQFLEVVRRDEIRIHIWERGAGYTLASGSSSCAAATAAYRLGLCDGRVIVHNPGGEILVEIEPDLRLTMTGPVAKVYAGRMELPDAG